MNSINLPALIGHKSIPIEVLDIGFLYEEPLRRHRRLRVFAEKGLGCSYCGREGVYLIKTVGRRSYGDIHIDVYTNDFHLMTIDHVIPKSRGGSNDIDNLVPCCDRCNTKKGSKLI